MLSKYNNEKRDFICSPNSFPPLKAVHQHLVYVCNYNVMSGSNGGLKGPCGDECKDEEQSVFFSQAKI